MQKKLVSLKRPYFLLSNLSPKLFSSNTILSIQTVPIVLLVYSYSPDFFHQGYSFFSSYYSLVLSLYSRQHQKRKKTLNKKQNKTWMLQFIFSSLTLTRSCAEVTIAAAAAVAAVAVAVDVVGVQVVDGQVAVADRRQ